MSANVTPGAHYNTADVTVEAGGYTSRRKNSGERGVYRFQSLSGPDFPAIFELSSRAPEGIDLGHDTYLAPLPIGEGVASFSAMKLLPGNARVELPVPLAEDTPQFLAAGFDGAPEPKQIGVRGVTIAEVQRGLAETYGVEA
jgi:hypothetical protein